MSSDSAVGSLAVRLFGGLRGSVVSMFKRRPILSSLAIASVAGYAAIRWVRSTHRFTHATRWIVPCNRDLYESYLLFVAFLGLGLGGGRRSLQASRRLDWKGMLMITLPPNKPSRYMYIFHPYLYHVSKNAHLVRAEAMYLICSDPIFCIN